MNCPPDRLFPERVVPILKTKFIGRDYRYSEVIRSTNERALRMVRDAGEKRISEGTVVVAEEQTAGKGRRGRFWLSPYAQGLWVSVILRPMKPPSLIPKVALISALAVARAIAEETGHRADIKWPNDVLMGGKKVCGILIESAMDSDGRRHIVIGIGMNVNVPEHAMPIEVRRRATSVGLVVGGAVDRPRLLAALLFYLEQLYGEWVAVGFDHIRDELRRVCVSVGHRVHVIEADGRWTGDGVDIAPDGALLVRRASDGTVAPVYAADVSLVY